MKRLSGAGFGWGVALGIVMLQAAWAASPIPDFPLDGTVAVKDVPDSFGTLRRFLREHRSPVGAKYHVAVVAYSDPQNRDGPDFGDESGDYINRVVEAWRGRVDTQNAVIILLSLRNRDIIVHPFSRWARLGWEQKAVVRTIDGSAFARFARAGDYDAAVKALVLAIDAELDKRLKEEAAQQQRTERLIEQATARNQVFEEVVKQEQYDPPRAREAHQQAVAGVENARSALAQGEVRKAFDLAWAANGKAALAERLVPELKAKEAPTRASLQALKERAAALDQTLGGVDFSATEVHRHLVEANKAIQEANQFLETLYVEEAASYLSRTEASLALADQALASARELHAFKTRTVPRIIAALVGLGVLLWLISLRLRSARRRREAEALITQWEELLGRVAGNLLKFEDEHALILGRADLLERFDGETARPVREAAQELDRLFLSYEVAQRVLGEARQALASGGALGWLREKPFAVVIGRLSTEPVHVRTEDVTERKLFLPERREVRMKPQELLAEMQASWERALRHVEQLEASFRATWEEFDRLKEELRALQTLEERLVELELPSPLQAETAVLAEKLRGQHERSRRDPLGAQRKAKPLALPLSKLLARTERLVQAVSRLREEVQPRRQEASARVEQLRGQGLAVEEPGFEPAAMLAYIDRMSAEALSAARAGRDEEAVSRQREAQESAAELLELCERTHRSREESGGRIDEAERRLRGLRERLPERRERIEALRREHADEALQPALDNAEESAGVLERAERCLSEARACVTPQAQRYLAGEELIHRAVQNLESVDALYQEIETKAGDLALARQEAEQALKAAERTFEELRELLKGEVFASAETADTYKHLEEGIPETRRKAEAQRPNWPSLRRESRRHESQGASTLERARVEKEAWEKALKLQKELTSWRETYAGVLARSADDREATNALFESVTREFNETVARTRGPRPAWPRILESLQRAAEGFEKVKKMGEADFAQAANARNALASAEAAIQGADSIYGHGVSADLGGARKQLSQATRLLTERQYEKAAQVAQDAWYQAHRAASDAQERVREYEERERRRRESSSSSFSSSSFSSSSFRSGSSSFGSSSGRSSFGSSSGRSKW